MTVSTDLSAPLVVVVGSTGIQGGSVVRNLIESDKPYRLRGLTRDVAKQAAKDLRDLGVETVAVEIRVGNEDAVRAAFSGADVVFGVTNFWEHMDGERELAEGKLMADAAAAVGAKQFIFSGLPYVSKLSGGKYRHVVHFDSKARVVEYARTRLPTVDVQAGYYMTNLVGLPGFAPTKRDDGSFVWEQPCVTAREAVWPYIDTARDYGLFVRYAIESSDYAGGGEIYTIGEWLYPADVAAILERVRGVKIELVTLPDKRARYTELGFPARIVDDFCDVVDALEFGFYYELDKSEAQKKIYANLPRKPRTLEEFLDATPEFFAA